MALTHRLDDRRYTDAMQPGYSAIDLPVLICWGEDDTSWVPLPRGHGLAALIPGARLHTFPDAGHLAPLDAPAELATTLLTFLTSLRTSKYYGHHDDNAATHTHPSSRTAPHESSVESSVERSAVRRIRRRSCVARAQRVGGLPAGADPIALARALLAAQQGLVFVSRTGMDAATRTATARSLAAQLLPDPSGD
ncbi:hypothetical protein [Streptomyces sp. CNZ287]|uniref:hypothetical protein n=1 Tax=Streptomyces sp. B22F1 TaxID=3153566 RepID=UPI00119C3D47